MSWTIICVRAPTYMVEDSHNRPFHTSEELPWIDNDTAIDSEDGTPAPGRPPPDVTLCITTRHFPKNPGLGFVFGRDRETCDVLLPSGGQEISKRQFAVTFRTDSSAVILRNLSKHLTYIDDELGPRRLQTQISFGQYTIRVRLPQFDIELTRPWSDDEITSPHYTSFLAKLARMLPNLGGMRLDSSAASTMQSSASRNQDGYRLGAVLGHGKSSIVYHGSHRETGDIVAIKRYNQSSSGSAEACKELGILSTLNHRHIITIHAFNFCIGQQAQLIMEYAPQGSMAYQSINRSFLYHEARTILHQLLQALGYLHSKGITHRDVKPDNILIMTREPMHAKLADFALSSNAKRPMTVCGTERYTAPEVYRPPYTAKVDIWSVGVIVMELWIGLPSQPKTAEYGKWAEMLRTNRLETGNPEIEELLDACLQLQPTERWSAEQCLNLALFRSRTGTLPDAAGATHEIDATRSASPTKVVDGRPERAPCHAIEADLPDTAPCFTVENGLPDTALCHTEASQARYSQPHQAEIRECGNEDQGLHLSQLEWIHQKTPEGWPYFSPLAPWSPTGLDGRPVDGQGVGDTAPCQLEENDRRCPSQDQAETTQLAAAGEHGDDDQELHLSQLEWMHQQTPEGWPYFSPLAPWSPTGLDSRPVDGQGVGDMAPRQLVAAGEYGNDDQGLHLSQPEWMHQKTPEGWPSRYPPRSTWDWVDLDGQAADDQNDGTSGHSAVARNESSLLQPVPARDDYVFYKGTTYHFFRWQGRTIAYTNPMVNLTQLLAAVGGVKPANRKIRDIFRHTKYIVRGDGGIRGTFVSYHNVVQVCRCLQINMAGLPDFLVSLEGAGNNDGGRRDDDSVEFFDWRGQQIAHCRGMVNVTQILMAAGRHPNVLKTKAFQKLLQNTGQPSRDDTTAAGTFIPYATAIKVCTRLYIRFDDLPDFITGGAAPQFTSDCFHFFEWHGRSVAHVPDHHLVNATHMFTAVGYSRSTLADASFDNHFSKRYIHKGSAKTQGTYVLYGDAIRACQAKAIDTRQLPVLLLDVESD